MTIGLVMVAWCGSGIVMMYVQYPSVSKTLALAGLSPLNLHNCCNTDIIDELGLVDIYRFKIEMMADEPVLRINGSNGKNPIVYLRRPATFAITGAELANEISQTLQTNLGISGDSEYRLVERDQWTVTNFYNSHRPLHQFTMNDDLGSQWYISNSTGELVQYSTRQQRFWNWVGPVTHWLYPTFLRRHTSLWAQAVI